MSRPFATVGRCCLLALLALILPLGVASAQSQDAARTVEGRIVNGTSGGGSLEGQAVLLHEEGTRRHDHMEAQADAGGRFKFEGIRVEPDTAYGVSTVYQGALYGVDLDLSEGSPAPVTLTVYEATEQDSVLTVPSVSVLVSQADKVSRTLWALEIFKVYNSSDRTYVTGGAGPMSLLRFGLPVGVSDLQVDTNIQSAQLFQVDAGFALAANVPPGEYEVMFAYAFPYEGSTATLEKTLWYGADNVRVLLPSEIAELRSDSLRPQERVLIGERTYNLVQGEALGRGERIAVELTGLPVATFGDRLSASISQVPLEFVAPVALGIFLAALLAFAVRTRRRDRPMERLPFASASGERHAPTAADVERSLLVQKLAQLDASFEKGESSEGEYNRRRSELARRLGELSRRM